VYLENVDDVVQKAVDSGAKLLHPVQNQFYGDRSGTLIDPFGHMWSVATHVEDVSPEEMKKRMAAATSQAAHG
jgi:PhnB protein